MDIEQHNVRCYICGELTEEYDNNVTQIANHTATPMHQLVKTFIGTSDSDNYVDDSSQFCIVCVNKINEYDLAIVTAKRIENELKEIYLTTISKSTETDFYHNNDGDFLLHFDQDPDLDLKYSVISVINNTKEINKYENIDDKEYDSSSSPKVSVSKRRGRKLKKTVADDSNQKIVRPQKIIKPIANNDQTQNDRKKVLKSESQNSNSNSSMKCEKCSIKFEIKSEWQAHMKITHQSPQRRFICDLCGQSYTRKSSLIVHIKMHKGTGPHECDLCDKQFKRKGSLVRHMPFHTGEWPYQCYKCGKQFRHYSSFHSHRSAHENVLHKKCSICGLEFRRSSNLSRHMRVHTGVKPYECPTCGKKFAQRYNMTLHYRTHQGIPRVINKTHVCLICNMSFTKRSKLVEHLAKQHQSYTSENLPETTSSITVSTITKELQIDPIQTSLTKSLNKKLSMSKISPDNVTVTRFLLHNTKSVVELKQEMLSETI